MKISRIAGSIPLLLIILSPVANAKSSSFEGYYEFQHGYEKNDWCSSERLTGAPIWPGKTMFLGLTQAPETLYQGPNYGGGIVIGEQKSNDIWSRYHAGGCLNTNPERPQNGEAHLIRIDELTELTGEGVVTNIRRMVVVFPGACPRSGFEELVEEHWDEFECYNEKFYFWREITR